MLHFKKGFRSFNTENLVSVCQRASKLPAVKVGGHNNKSPPALAPLKSVGLGSNPGEVESFSKFDGRSFCSPLTYRPQIFSIERSKSFKKAVKSFKMLAAV